MEVYRCYFPRKIELEFLIDKCTYIIIKTPHNMPQGPVGGNIHEAHLSNWGVEDFPNLYRHEIEEHVNKQNPGQIDIMNLFILQGL